ncbi:MAG TPA: T9SS type A sorting domain-containing protein [Bacteroidia bacterium]|jgi:hypothetical protein|nr:T9SS type A sorting domain-containing protein [Bacteroidia bacterium]
MKYINTYYKRGHCWWVYILVLFIFTGYNTLYAQVYIITDIAGNTYGYAGDGGAATNAELNNPISVFAGIDGNIYISDWGNSRLRLVSASGIISTIAGNGVYGFSGDGGPASLAELNGPMGVFVDGSGNIYLADIGNERIRKINTSGVINTIAGNGIYGFSGDGGPATVASFEDPAGICSDALGDIYIADEFNNRVRMINTNGIISTIAGCAYRGYSGDSGPATLAEFYYPSGVASDAAGNLFIADESNNCIREVNNMGIISTIAGNGLPGYTGDGGQAISAELSNAAGVGVDNSGNIYITDGFNNRVRKINANGIISTIAGNGKKGFSGLGDTATLAKIYDPVSVSIDAGGNIYFANAFNYTVEKLSALPEVPIPPGIFVYPNPNKGIFTITIENFNPILNLEVYNVLGQRISYSALTSEASRINLSTCSPGVYIYRIISTGNKLYGTGKLIIY